MRDNMKTEDKKQKMGTSSKMEQILAYLRRMEENDILHTVQYMFHSNLLPKLTYLLATCATAPKVANKFCNGDKNLATRILGRNSDFTAQVLEKAVIPCALRLDSFIQSDLPNLDADVEKTSLRKHVADRVGTKWKGLGEQTAESMRDITTLLLQLEERGQSDLVGKLLNGGLMPPLPFMIAYNHTTAIMYDKFSVLMLDVAELASEIWDIAIIPCGLRINSFLHSDLPAIDVDLDKISLGENGKTRGSKGE